MRKVMCVSIDTENYHKLHVLNSVRKFFFDEKDVSISSITDQALREYFESHKEEIDNLMKRYQENGGCEHL